MDKLYSFIEGRKKADLAFRKSDKVHVKKKEEQVGR